MGFVLAIAIVFATALVHRACVLAHAVPVIVNVILLTLPGSRLTS